MENNWVPLQKDETAKSFVFVGRVIYILSHSFQTIVPLAEGNYDSQDPIKVHTNSSGLH